MGSPGAIVGKQTWRYLFWSELLLPEHLLFQRLRLMPKLTHGAFMVDMVDTMVYIEDMDTLDTIDHMVDMDSMDMERGMLSLLLNQLPMLKLMPMLGTDTTDMDMVLAMLAIMAILDITVHTLMDTDTTDLTLTLDTMARDLLNQLPNPLLMLKPMLMLGTEDTDMVDTHTTVDTDMEDMPTDHTDTTDTEVTGVKHLLKISFQMLI